MKEILTKELWKIKNQNTTKKSQNSSFDDNSLYNTADTDIIFPQI